MSDKHPQGLLAVRNLQIAFDAAEGGSEPAPVVDRLNFDLYPGETLGLIGESGSGKSLTSLSLLGMLPPRAKVKEGEILFEGENLLTKSQREITGYRGKRIGMIVQDPLSSLNPLFTIGNQLLETLRIHTPLRGAELKERAKSLLRMMQITDADECLKKYPHQLSGGMQQRVLGAIVLGAVPEVLIADEPTTALDATVQAAYLKLLKSIQAETSLAILFITHDLRLVGRVCDRVAVMYAGSIVETASTEKVLGEPTHPYTKALLQAVPSMKRDTIRLASIPGVPPTMHNMPSGCRFHTRCWLYEQLGRPDRCRTETPSLESVSPAHAAACHFPAEASKGSVDASGSVFAAPAKA